VAYLRTPIRWLGGKSAMVGKLLPWFPRHQRYIEPFGGGASLLLAKPRVAEETYNDLDERLVNLFQVIKNPLLFDNFFTQAALTPFSRGERNRVRLAPDEPSDAISRALSTFILSRQSFGGMIDKTAWGLVTGTSVGGMAQSSHQWLSTIQRLRQVHRRLKYVDIRHGSWAALSSLDSSDTLWYLDPPYVPETRRDGAYQHEMSLEDHAALLETINGYKGMVLLSGYPNELYSRLEKIWTRFDFEVKCFVVAKTKATGLQGEGALASQKRTECLWINPAAHLQLRKEGRC
jgi:DNA adenine methylase